MRRPFALLGLALLLPVSVLAQTPSAPQSAAPTTIAAGNTFEGLFRIGGALNDPSGNLNRVAEYDVMKDTGNVAVQFWGSRGTTYFDVQAFYGGHQDAQRYVADIDVNRFVQAHASYVRFPHRLDHDPLTYMDSVSTLGGTFAVKSDDTDPGEQYAISNGEWRGHVEVRLPQGVSFFVGHRMQTRSGTHQVMTISHCSTCHTTAYTRQMDEGTRDIDAGARYAARRVVLEYAYQNRNFEDDAGTILHLYDKAQQPAQLTDVFLGRVQYDSRSGPLPIAQVAQTTKGTHRLRGSLHLPRDIALNGSFTTSEARNEDVPLGVDYTGGTARLVVPVNGKLTFRADFRRYSIDADSIFIDVNEPVTPAGPNAGLTYAEAYPVMGEQDYLRESSLSRTPTKLAMELMVRPAKKTFLRLGYEWEQIERDTFEVHKTTTNTVNVLGRTQWGKTLDARFRFQYEDTRDPFMYEHAAVPQVLQPFMSPGNVPFTGLQYDTMYASRQGTLTAYPTSAMRVEPTVTWTPSAHVALTGHYRWRQGENDDLNYSTWERTAHNPGLDLWIAPGERWTLSAGYQYQRERLETLFTTLAFVG